MLFRSSRAKAVALTVAAATAAGLASAVNATDANAVVNGRGTIVARLTGPGAINDTVGKYDIIGTDLGILWDNGKGEVLAAFGDTQSFDGWSLLRGQLFQLRSNALLRSRDRNLSNGMTFTGHSGPPGYAKRVVKASRREITIVPTGGVAVNGKQYMGIQAVNVWGDAGRWMTRYGALAVSGNNGRTFKRVVAYRPNYRGNRKFQQVAMMKDGGYVYVYGTPSGRYGAVYLGRVPEGKIENLGAYEYWSVNHWHKGSPTAATPIMSAPTGELSVAYNRYLGRYVSLATRDGAVLRTAPRPEGPWTPGQNIVPASDPLGGYAPFIHPWSLDGPTMYFTYSIWHGYQVYLMRVNLRR
ncbi:DUF4185 domain-containing protein [Gordonia sp. X0973]|uniref:DUF4185 domain-containing protein n=1 Tax=Gordonia sp. X0973 TaxID=2742602 RepID=UPI000F520F9A|nr:DUF4185 domain-containing protein [Gordonia sp. X0973]QKT08671.1 DUF4185 domain-containing protein [Gordonia sp. X0973]